MAVRSFGSRRDSRIAVMASSLIPPKAPSHPYPKALDKAHDKEQAMSSHRVGEMVEVQQEVAITNGSVLGTLESRALAQAYVDQLGLVLDAPLNAEQERWLLGEIVHGAACVYAAAKVADTFLGPPDGAS